MSVLLKFLTSLGIDYDLSRILISCSVLLLSYIALRCMRSFIRTKQRVLNAPQQIDKPLSDLDLTSLTEVFADVVAEHARLVLLQKKLYRAVVSIVLLLALF